MGPSASLSRAAVSAASIITPPQKSLPARPRGPCIGWRDSCQWYAIRPSPALEFSGCAKRNPGRRLCIHNDYLENLSAIGCPALFRDCRRAIRSAIFSGATCEERDAHLLPRRSARLATSLPELPPPRRNRSDAADVLRSNASLCASHCRSRQQTRHAALVRRS